MADEKVQVSYLAHLEAVLALMEQRGYQRKQGSSHMAKLWSEVKQEITILNK